MGKFDSAEVPSRHGRLRKLTIRNFMAIGPEAVTIEVDEIIVLVGPNNSGKSSILKAYEVFSNEGDKKKTTLTKDHFHNCDLSLIPEIEAEYDIYKRPGEKWIMVDDETGQEYIREKMYWPEPGTPKRVGWNPSENDWDSGGEQPLGAANVAKQLRPEAYRVEAFDDPDKQAKNVIDLFKRAVEARYKWLKRNKDDEKTIYEEIRERIVELRKKIKEENLDDLSKIEEKIEAGIKEIFPGYAVSFDAFPTDNEDDTVDLFGARVSPRLLMGPENGHKSAVDVQGSGARRTLLWSALKILAEEERKAAGQGKPKKQEGERPYILLLDEPEICLHPNAVRDACRVLYDLPVGGNWQVMVTTHSPVFIDFSRDNTSIVRVDRNIDGDVSGTTIFRGKKAKLGDDDKENLKLLNIADPSVAEFFFGGGVVVVEGDTEYTAFRHVIAEFPDDFKDLNIVRARGKATIASVCRVLNQFDVKYSILHDADQKTTTRKKDGAKIGNPAWGSNQTIRDAAAPALSKSNVRLVASLPNFEEAYLEGVLNGQKPYNALVLVKKGGKELETIKELLAGLVDHSAPLPDGATEWADLEDLESKLPS